MERQVGAKKGKTNDNQKFWTPTYQENKIKKKEKEKTEEGKKERKMKMIKADLDEIIMVKLNNRGKAQAKNYSLRWKEIRIVLQISNRER